MDFVGEFVISLQKCGFEGRKTAEKGNFAGVIAL
jgi:hypothetical protein